jgi:ATP-dependent Clp protease ATP-binding subunit ClpC
MDAAPSRSLFRYFMPADTFVRILVRSPDSTALRARPGLNRVAYRRLVIEACCPEYAGDMAGRVAEQCPHDPLAAEDLLYQLCIEVNPQLDIHCVRLAPVRESAARSARAAPDPKDAKDSMERLRQRTRNLRERLARRVLGQDAALEHVVDHLRRMAAGLSEGQRPLGTFLLMGRTGTGKTELARALARELFAERDEAAGAGLVRIDCGEYALGHEHAKLVGAPPGYIGHDQGGFLTDAVRKRPDCVVLFDEVEKAHPRLHNLLLSILDEGRLTDSRGQVADFTRSVVVLTSNVGAGELNRAARGMGFSPPGVLDADTAEAIAVNALEAIFSPEFLGRLDARLVFRDLTPADAVAIARRQLSELALRARRRGAALCFTPAVPRWIASRGFHPESGVRELRRVIEREVEARLAEWVLSGATRPGGLLRACVRNGELVLAPAA